MFPGRPYSLNRLSYKLSRDSVLHLSEQETNSSLVVVATNAVIESIIVSERDMTLKVLSKATDMELRLSLFLVVDVFEVVEEVECLLHILLLLLQEFVQCILCE